MQFAGGGIGGIGGIHQSLSPHGGPPSTVTVLDYTESKVGKTVEASKIRYTWILAFDEHQHRIELTNTKISGKKRIHVDGYLQHQQQVGGFLGFGDFLVVRFLECVFEFVFFLERMFFWKEFNVGMFF